MTLKFQKICTVSLCKTEFREKVLVNFWGQKVMEAWVYSLMILLLPFFSGSSPYNQKRVQHQLFGDGPTSYLPLQFYFASLKAWMIPLSEDEAREIYLKGTPETLKLLGIKTIFDKYTVQKVNFSIMDFCSKCEVRIWSHFFFYLGFLSRTFTIHRTAGEVGGYFFNSSLPLPPASQTLAGAITAESPPLYITRTWTRTGNLWFPSERKSLTTKLRTLCSEERNFIVANILYRIHYFHKKWAPPKIFHMFFFNSMY